MKLNKIAILVSAMMIVLLAASCTTSEINDDTYLYNDNAIVTSFRNASDSAIQSFIAKTKNDKTKSDIRKEISSENRANYTIEQATASRINNAFKASIENSVSGKGLQLGENSKSRFILEGTVDISYGRTAEGETWFYDVYITAWDRQNVPLDYNRSDLIKHENVLENTTVIDEINRWPEMSWSTHGEIYAANSEDAEKALLSQLDKEIRNSFAKNFFQF